jgi:hypothetical protein
MINNLFSMIDHAIKTKRFVGGLGRLQRDGTIAKLNGQIFQRRTTRNGKSVILMDNLLGNRRVGQNKHWQLVLTENLVALNEEGWVHTKKEI